MAAWAVAVAARSNRTGFDRTEHGIVQVSTKLLSHTYLFLSVVGLLFRRFKFYLPRQFSRAHWLFSGSSLSYTRSSGGPGVFAGARLTGATLLPSLVACGHSGEREVRYLGYHHPEVLVL